MRTCKTIKILIKILIKIRYSRCVASLTVFTLAGRSPLSTLSSLSSPHFPLLSHPLPAAPFCQNDPQIGAGGAQVRPDFVQGRLQRGRIGREPRVLDITSQLHNQAVQQRPDPLVSVGLGSELELELELELE